MLHSRPFILPLPHQGYDIGDEGIRLQDSPCLVLKPWRSLTKENDDSGESIVNALNSTSWRSRSTMKRPRELCFCHRWVQLPTAHYGPCVCRRNPMRYKLQRCGEKVVRALRPEALCYRGSLQIQLLFPVIQGVHSRLRRSATQVVIRLQVWHESQ